jgi:hypothetical protein
MILTWIVSGASGYRELELVFQDGQAVWSEALDSHRYVNHFQCDRIAYSRATANCVPRNELKILIEILIEISTLD